MKDFCVKRSHLKVRFVILNSLLLTANISFASKSKLRDLVLRTEDVYDLPTFLLDSIIEQESSYRIKAVNRANKKHKVKIPSFGLGQLTLDTAKWHCRLRRKQLLNPERNIKCSAKVLKWQLDRYEGHLGKAVAAYQWGTPCICDGKVYVQKLFKKTRTCVTYRKGKPRPILCEKKGTFWNQWYVDSVLERRKQKLLDQIKVVDSCFFYSPCDTRLVRASGGKKLNNFDISLLNKILEIAITHSLGRYTSFRKQIYYTPMRQNNILDVLMFKTNNYFPRYFLTDEHLFNSQRFFEFRRHR